MPTFLTEYFDPEENARLAGPYIVAKDWAEADRIADHLIMDPDGTLITVVGELGDSIPMNVDHEEAKTIQARVMAEVEQLIKRRS